jgi:hypothetical protein
VTPSHALRIPLAAVAVLTIAAIVVPSAAADISGPCTASIAGQNVKGRGTGALSDAITVEKNAVVPVTMGAGSQISHLKIQIEFAGMRWTVRDKPSHGTSWASDVKVKNYAKYGVGLYKVIGSSSGGVSCSGSALVKVKGNPLSTIAGIVGLVAALAGIAGVAGALGLAAHAGAMGFGRSLLGLLGGLIGGLGLGVLLQQYALVYPTPAATAVFLGGGALAGVGLTLLGKILGSGAAAAAA